MHRICSSFMGAVALFIMSNCGRCSEQVAGLSPNSLTGKAIFGHVSLGTDGFAHLTGFQFTARFDDAFNFVTRSSFGQEESNGVYQYNKNSASTAELVLMPKTPSLEGQELKITLRFIDAKRGTYEAHLRKGGQGQQMGTFELK